MLSVFFFDLYIIIIYLYTAYIVGLFHDYFFVYYLNSNAVHGDGHYLPFPIVRMPCKQTVASPFFYYRDNKKKNRQQPKKTCFYALLSAFFGMFLCFFLHDRSTVIPYSVIYFNQNFKENSLFWRI